MSPSVVFDRALELLKELPQGYAVETHFKPSYNPWDQRLCLVPDADLFNSIREGKSSVVTESIETFTETGLKLKSGEHLDADGRLTTWADVRRTQIVEEPVLRIEGGRHPVVEAVRDEPFEPNDLVLHDDRRQRPVQHQRVALVRASVLLVAEHARRHVRQPRRPDRAPVRPASYGRPEARRQGVAVRVPRKRHACGLAAPAGLVAGCLGDEPQGAAQGRQREHVIPRDVSRSSLPASDWVSQMR